MILILNPQKSLASIQSTEIDVVDENTIIIDGIGYHINPNLVELDLAQGQILRGYRDESGMLTLSVLYKYSPQDSLIWETPPYRGYDPEIWQPTGKPTPEQLVELTGKTAAELAAQAVQASIDNIKSILSDLDKIIPRWGEELCAHAKFTPFKNVAGIIQQKIDLRGQLRKLLSSGGN